jgi:CheY-like chemotaxis protein
MSLPHVLVVDDSEVIRTFEQSALSGHYSTSVACNGREALDKLRQARPAAMLLDLSMPEMSGMEVLTTVRADAALAGTPIIIVSSEDHRRDDCLRAGADQFLAKPVRAPELLATVHRVIDAARRHAMRGSVLVLFLQVGEVELGIPLEGVRFVVSESATIPVPGGPPHLKELINLHGAPVLVLDTAARLGTSYSRPAQDRIFVVLAHEGRQFALRVDSVRDPEEIPPDRLLPPSRLGGAAAAGVLDVLEAIALSDRGPIPILDAGALVAGHAVDQLEPLMGVVKARAPGPS